MDTSAAMHMTLLKPCSCQVQPKTHNQLPVHTHMFLLGKYYRTERANTKIRYEDVRVSRQQKPYRRKGTVLQALSPSGGQAGSFGDLDPNDTNELTTALNNAIAAEDYSLASKLRDRLRQLSGGDAASPADWQSLGIPAWLADRAERIGYRFPTGSDLFTHVTNTHVAVWRACELPSGRKAHELVRVGSRNCM